MINGIQATGASHNQALGMLDNIIQSQAVMLATNHVFLGISVLMVISVSAVWLAPKPAPGSMGGRPAGGH